MTREYVHFGPRWTSWEELLCVKRMFLCQTLNQQVAEAKYQGLFLLLPKNGLGQWHGETIFAVQLSAPVFVSSAEFEEKASGEQI